MKMCKVEIEMMDMAEYNEMDQDQFDIYKREWLVYYKKMNDLETGEPITDTEEDNRYLENFFEDGLNEWANSIIASVILYGDKDDVVLNSLKEEVSREAIAVMITAMLESNTDM